MKVNINTTSVHGKKKKRKKEKEKQEILQPEKKSKFKKPYDALALVDKNIPCIDLTVDDSCKHANKKYDTLKVPEYVRCSSMKGTNNKKGGSINGYSPIHRIVNGKQQYQLEELLRQGHVRQKGKWQPDEIELLENNMEEFLEHNNVKDFEGLICIRTQEDRRFRKRSQFLLNMCQGIQRTGADVTARIQVQFTPFLKKGHYSKEEVAELKRLYKVHGNKWKMIGQVLNRSYLNLLNIHHFTSKEWNRGAWSLEEQKLLITSVLEYLESGKEVAWKKVSGRVKTRPGQICRIEWYKRFRQITDSQSYERWLAKTSHLENQTEKSVTISNSEVYKLITLISDANIDDEYFVDWKLLTRSFVSEVSAAWLKWKFKSICKEVPQGHKLEFTDLIEQLLVIYQTKIAVKSHVVTVT